MVRDWKVSLGIVLLAAALGMQMPEVGVDAQKQLYLTLPFALAGGIMLASRMPVLTRLALGLATVAAITLLAVRQGGRSRPDDVFMLALPIAAAAVLGLCKNRKVPGVYAVIATCVVIALYLILGTAGWPDLTTVLVIAFFLFLRSAPLPKARFV